MTSTPIGDTLGFDAACQRTWDAVVVGAGPAGALAARQLAGAGARVLLVDKKRFPRPKVCGACLNGQALSVLRASGLETLVVQLGAVFPRAFHLSFQGRSASFSLPVGLVVSRSRLDAALVEAAVEAGAHWLQETQVSLEPGSGATRTAKLSHAGSTATVKAKVLVVAAGLGNTCLEQDPRIHTRISPHARIGAGCVLDTFPGAYQPSTIFMAVGREGYVGMVRDEDGRLNVAAALDKGLIKRSGGPGFGAASLIAEAGAVPIPALETSHWLGTAPLTRQTRPIAGHRLFLIGDATGYVEPFTGEGMAWALASGQAITSLALRGIRDWQPPLEQEWSRLHRRLVGRRQTICRGLAMVLRHPRLSRVVFAAATRAPAMAQFLVRQVNSPPITLEHLTERELAPGPRAPVSFP